MNMKRAALALVFAGALSAADPAVVTQAKKQIAEKKYDAAITALETAQNTDSKSPAIKATLVEALLGKADGMMADNALPPRTKYPDALRTYRKVLTLDKENKQAQSNIATIESIYKSMGRPIPQ
jgi:cytochrome c-type biogenesis protein CcmH/NrfG